MVCPMSGQGYRRLIGLEVYDLDAQRVGVVRDIGFDFSGEGRVGIYLIVETTSKIIAVPVESVKAARDIVLLREGYETSVKEQGLVKARDGLGRAGSPEVGRSVVTTQSLALEERDTSPAASSVREGVVSTVIPRCPKCGKALIFEPKKRQWYCYNCRKYVRINRSVEENVPKCPDCGLPLSYIEDYRRWYCYNCSKYVNVGSA